METSQAKKKKKKKTTARFTSLPPLHPLFGDRESVSLASCGHSSFLLASRQQFSSVSISNTDRRADVKHPLGNMDMNKARNENQSRRLNLPWKRLDRLENFTALCRKAFGT
ncbi:hypothetical protein AA313_de0203290 [Arthrobotrys entomopaga]|nr:hypothetical protein AA313_de0203290 [Arthrobotrys entomopaga]